MSCFNPTPPAKSGASASSFAHTGRFLGIPMGETLNFRGDADVVLCKWARRVQEGLESRQGVDQRVTFLRDQLIELLRKNQRSALWRMQERNNDIVAYCVQASSRLMAECEFGTSSQEPRPLEAIRICSSNSMLVCLRGFWRRYFGYGHFRKVVSDSCSQSCIFPAAFRPNVAAPTQGDSYGSDSWDLEQDAARPPHGRHLTSPS